MTKPSIEDFQEAAKKHNITKWAMHDCSICGYNCAYLFEANDVFYDSGCYCTGGQTLERRSWQDIVNHYNMQKNENVVKKMNDFWRFKND